jgi:hypothetical protein
LKVQDLEFCRTDDLLTNTPPASRSPISLETRHVPPALIGEAYRQRDRKGTSTFVFLHRMSRRSRPPGLPSGGRVETMESVMRSACVCIAIVTLAASSAWSQGNPVGAASPQAPIGHRQPTLKDLPPDVARDEKPVGGSRGEQQPGSVSPRGQNSRARADGPSQIAR